MAVLVAIETVVLVLLAVLVAGLLRSHAEILRQLHEMGAGLEPEHSLDSPVSLRPRGDVAARGNGIGPAFDIAGAGLFDDAVQIPVVDVRHRTLLAFLSSGCLTCQTFWEAFRDAPGLALPPDVRVVVVTKDAAEESVSTLRNLAPADLPVVMSSTSWAEYEVPGSPYFVLVDGPIGRVRGEGTGMTWPQVHGLLSQAADDDAIALDEVAAEARIDRELIASGIRPGDPSLYRDAQQILDGDGARG
jgi:hypothetical protein